MTSVVPKELIAWESEPRAPVEHVGRVKFQPNKAGVTRLDIMLAYNPFAGAVGHGVAALVRADPKSEMNEDLMRMKNMLETGMRPHDVSQKREPMVSLH